MVLEYGDESQRSSEMVKCLEVLGISKFIRVLWMF